jgi:undecaprenyl-diphosphatase
MMLLGFRRDEAARYTFLLSLPTILAASGFDLLRHPEILTNSSHVSILLIGLVTSFISAVFVMRWFIRYLGTHTLTPFAYYRLILALFILFILGL